MDLSECMFFFYKPFRMYVMSALDETKINDRVTASLFGI